MTDVVNQTDLAVFLVKAQQLSKEHQEWVQLHQWIREYKKIYHLTFQQLFSVLELEMDHAMLHLLCTKGYMRNPDTVDTCPGGKLRRAITRIIVENKQPPLYTQLTLSERLKDLLLDKEWLTTRKVRYITIEDEHTKTLIIGVWSDYNLQSLMKDIGEELGGVLLKVLILPMSNRLDIMCQ